MVAYVRHSFDQARLIRQNEIFAANGIGPNGENFTRHPAFVLHLSDLDYPLRVGMPLDAKAVTRL